MFGIENFYLFLSVSLLINISPGPDMLYTAARSLSQGSKAGILSALGVFTGCLVHLSAAVFGLSKIIEESILVFSMIKYAGAAYLIYLGAKAIFHRKHMESFKKKLEPVSNRKIFFQGMITNVLNPKVAIFFLSFLPQFINPESPFLREQIALLGLWFDIQGTLILVLIALITGYFQTVLQKNKTFWKWQEKITGAILIGIGIKVMISKR